MPNSETYDVAIVGARIAGSTLAAMLGRRGLRILLVDKATFPSDTLSTHLMYGDTFEIWEEIGVLERVRAIGSLPMGGIDWQRIPPSPPVEGRFWPVGGHPFGLCVRRIFLDEVLFTHACETPGVSAITNATVTELLWEADRVAGVRYERIDGSRRTRAAARASLVVGADGRFSLVADAVGAPEYNVVPPIFFPFYTYMRGVVPLEEPMLEVIDSEVAQGIIMLAPCEDDVWMGIVYTAQEQWESFRRDHTRLFWERLRGEPVLAERLAEAEMIAPVRGRGDLVNFMRVPAGRGWALVGDSGQHKDPVFGQGIGDASRTARLLTGYAMRALGGEQCWDSALAEFHAYRDADLLPNYEWMAKGKPQGWEQTEFDELMATLGASPTLAERFCNLFSHGVSASELFGAELRATWRELVGQAEGSTGLTGWGRRLARGKSSA